MQGPGTRVRSPEDQYAPPTNASFSGYLRTISTLSVVTPTWTRTLDPGPGAWTLDPGPWTLDLDPGPWTLDLDPGSWTWTLDLDPGPWIWILVLGPQGPGPCTLDPESGLYPGPGPSTYILDPRPWTWTWSRVQVQDPGVQGPESRGPVRTAY